MPHREVRADGTYWHCDGCGAWVRRAWLTAGRLLCPSCLTIEHPLAENERRDAAIAVAQELHRQFLAARQDGRWCSRLQKKSPGSGSE